MSAAENLNLTVNAPMSGKAEHEVSGLMQNVLATVFKGFDALLEMLTLWFDVREMFRRREYSFDPADDRHERQALARIEAEKQNKRASKCKLPTPDKRLSDGSKFLLRTEPRSQLSLRKR